MPTRSELIEAIKAAIADATDVFGYADIEGTTATLDGRFDMAQVADGLLARWPHIAGPQRIEGDAPAALGALPVGAIVECGSGMLWWKVASGMYGWLGTGVGHRCQPDVFMRSTPLAVLWSPEEVG